MSFKQHCGCVQHKDITDGKEFKLKRLSSRPYPKAVVDELISRDLLSPRATYLCDLCAELGHINKPDESKKIKVSHIDSIVDDIEKGLLNENDMVKLAGSLGRSQHDKFKQEAYETSQTYKDHIDNFSANEWFNTKNNIITGFLSEVVGEEERSSKQTVYLAAAVDCLMAATISNCITPMFFIFNIVSYFICGSKITSSVLSAFTPSGSYYTLKNWLHGQMLNLCSLPSAADIVTYFDNNQVLSRNWRVRYDAKVRLSVITSVIHILTSKLTTLQNNVNLDPRIWLYNTHIPGDTIVVRILNFIEHCSTVFTGYRNKFIIERLNKVYSEHSKDGKDFIDQLVENPEMKIPHGPTDNDPYTFIKHNHPNEPPKVIIGEPVMVNPCSYDSVRQVLNTLLNTITNNSDRKWTI